MPLKGRSLGFPAPFLQTLPSLVMPLQGHSLISVLAGALLNLCAFQHPFSKLCHHWLCLCRGTPWSLCFPTPFLQTLPSLVMPLQGHSLISLLSNTLSPNSAIIGYAFEGALLNLCICLPELPSKSHAVCALHKICKAFKYKDWNWCSIKACMWMNAGHVCSGLKKKKCHHDSNDFGFIFLLA